MYGAYTMNPINLSRLRSGILSVNNSEAEQLLYGKYGKIEKLVRPVGGMLGADRH